jgi:hypothetical protein
MSDERWLSDYVLEEAAEDERREIEARLAADPSLRERAQRLRDVAAELEALPPSVWSAVTGENDRRPVARRPRFPRGIPRLTAALAAAALFVAGLGAGALLEHGSAGTPGRTVALAPLGSAPTAAAGDAHLVGGDQLVLTVQHLPASRPQQYYEAWLMTSTTRLVPLASFRVGRGGQARLTLPLPAAASAYRYIDVSLQRVGAGTRHSADSVLRGATLPG